LIALILTLAGCGNWDVNSQDHAPSNISSQETQGDTIGQTTQDGIIGKDEQSNKDEPLDTGNQEITGGKTMLIGTWQDTPSIGSLDRQRYHFYDAGNYIFEYSQYDKEKRVLSEMGTWRIENDILTLNINRKVTVEGGEESTEALLAGDTSNEYAIVNGTIKTIEMDPPENEEYTLNDFYYDTKESPGFLTVLVGKDRYWKYTDDPDLYLNDPVKDGDIYRPWP